MESVSVTVFCGKKAYTRKFSCKKSNHFAVIYYMTNLECRKILLVDLESRALECEMHLKESGIPLTIGTGSRIQVPPTKSGMQYLESRIHGVETRMQDCLGFSSLRTTDAFPVVASLPLKNRRERSDDRKCVCCSQAMDFLKWADLNVKFCLFKEQLGFKKLSGRFTTMEKSTANELKTVFHS